MRTLDLNIVPARPLSGRDWRERFESFHRMKMSAARAQNRQLKYELAMARRQEKSES